MSSEKNTVPEKLFTYRLQRFPRATIPNNRITEKLARSKLYFEGSVGRKEIQSVTETDTKEEKDQKEENVPEVLRK